MPKVDSFFWFRRDLRLEDNRGLHRALSESKAVLPVFIFDETILSKLPKADARVTFLHDQVTQLKTVLKGLGSDLLVLHGDPIKLWPELIKQYPEAKLYANRDYEPYARARDKAVYDIFSKAGQTFISTKDQVIFEKNEVVKKDGLPYTVFTPYWRRWQETLNKDSFKSYILNGILNKNFVQNESFEFPTLKQIGHQRSEVDFPSQSPAIDTIKHYDQNRDIPSLPAGTSRLGLHLRFGTVSIRQWARTGSELNQAFLQELCWRDFYQQILWHFPHVAERAFKPAYDEIQWQNDEVLFKRWCEGKTGYPLVDAGMRQLNQTGYMHNRVRMVTASFLCKHLLIDWRWGEKYFAEKLLDFDLAANNGGWQWAAGTGCDAAPYFRVFNPTAQQAKFDPDFTYIKTWVPEFGTDEYPPPIVEHKMARERAIATYKVALSS